MRLSGAARLPEGIVARIVGIRIMRAYHFEKALAAYIVAGLVLALIVHFIRLTW